MKTFSQFMTEITVMPAIRQLTRDLLEHGLDPVQYVYLRLVENQPVPNAAAGAVGGPAGGPPAPAGGAGAAAGPEAEIKALTDTINGMIQKYGKTHPETAKIVANMQKEVQQLTAAAKQDAQAAQGGGGAAKPGGPSAQPGQSNPAAAGQPQPGQPAPAAAPKPGGAQPGQPMK